MKLSKEEKAARRAAFQAMPPAKKAEHILSYYKWPILLVLIALFALGSTLHRQLTKKEPVLYLAMVNIAVGDEMEKHLTSDYLAAAGFNAKKQEVYLYRDLYISEDADTLNHEYAYASKMKLTGAINAKKMDLVLMNREAYDTLSRSGFLLELTSSVFEDDPALFEGLLPFISANDLVLSDNVIEYQLGEAQTHEVKAMSVQNAIEVTALPLFAHAGFPDSVYLGVIANSERLPACLRFIDYLSSVS